MKKIKKGIFKKIFKKIFNMKKIKKEVKKKKIKKQVKKKKIKNKIGINTQMIYWINYNYKLIMTYKIYNKIFRKKIQMN